MEVASSASGEYSFAVGVEKSSIHRRAAEVERGGGGVDFTVNMV